MGGEADCSTEPFGALLRRYRGRRGLTQEELAERAGLHAQEISQLERGVVRKPHSTTVGFLADALNLDEQQRDTLFFAVGGGSSQGAGLRPALTLRDAPGPVASLGDGEALLASMPMDTLPPRAPLPAGSRMPLAPNPLFVGRGDELLQVAAALRGGDVAVALGQVVASTGLGGLGKTQLAVEFIHRYARYFSGGVFWLSFASADEVPLQIAACAAPEFEARSLEERLRLVTAAWQSAIPRLLVFDNCEEESLLEQWRPTSGGCRVLVTSRRPHWSPTLGVTALPLDLLPRHDSIELLRRYRSDLAADDPRLDALAAKLGDLPLALHLAGRYLLAYRAEVALDDYLVELEELVLIKHASLSGEGLDDSPSPTHHVQSVAQTFALCLGRLDREREVDRIAIALLARMACMAPGEPVPRDLLVKTLQDVDPLRWADGLRRLGAVGLVEEGEGLLRLHRLLGQFLCQEDLDPGAQSAVDRAMIDCGRAIDDGRITGLALAAVIPHLIFVAARATGDQQSLAQLCTATGQALHYAGDLRSARPWLDRAVDIWERAGGVDDPRHATSLVALGRLLQDQGDLAAARRRLERALSSRQRALGPDHPDTAISLVHLAWLLRYQGELEEARRLYERAVTICERVLGSDHPRTATSLNHLGIVVQLQGDLTAARLLHERALTIRQCTLGENHPDTAHSLNNLGHVLRVLGEMDRSRLLHERALAIRQRVLGPEHPDTCFSLTHLGVVLQAQGEIAAARSLLERALAIRQRTLGPEHPDTAVSLNYLALLLQARGEWTVARDLLNRSLTIRERLLGPGHPDTARSMHDIAVLLQAQGELNVARPLFERALAIRERVLGLDHPDTVATRRALAELAGEGDEAASGG